MPTRRKRRGTRDDGLKSIAVGRSGRRIGARPLLAPPAGRPKEWGAKAMVLRTVALFACRAIACAILLAFAVPAPVAAQTGVDLQLVLAVDASGSVDQYRFELQKQGYVAAFRHPRVLQSITSGPHQAIAVTMVQWTGPIMQVQ